MDIMPHLGKSRNFLKQVVGLAFFEGRPSKSMPAETKQGYKGLGEMKSIRNPLCERNIILNGILCLEGLSGTKIL